jgi:hypothetical protein
VAIEENGRSDGKEGQSEDFGDKKGYSSFAYSAFIPCRLGGATGGKPMNSVGPRFTTALFVKLAHFHCGYPMR